MSKAPSMPMFWDAYLADTTHLTTEEHGAYLLLLAAMWRRNGWVPDDDKDNARILGMSVAKWRKTKERLRDFLTFHEGQISQKNLQKIWKNTQEKIAKNAKNGALGGRPKSNKNKDIAKANGSVSVNPNESIPEPEPVKREAKASPKKGTRLPDDWTLPDECRAWAISKQMPEFVVLREAEKFRDFWRSRAGQTAVKLDWAATWRNWCRNWLEKNPTAKVEDEQTARWNRIAGGNQ